MSITNDHTDDLEKTVGSIASSLKDLSALLEERKKELERREDFDRWLSERIEEMKR